VVERKRRQRVVAAGGPRNPKSVAVRITEMSPSSQKASKSARWRMKLPLQRRLRKLLLLPKLNLRCAPLTDIVCLISRDNASLVSLTPFISWYWQAVEEDQEPEETPRVSKYDRLLGLFGRKPDEESRKAKRKKMIEKAKAEEKEEIEEEEVSEEEEEENEQEEDHDGEEGRNEEEEEEGEEDDEDDAEGAESLDEDEDEVPP